MKAPHLLPTESQTMKKTLLAIVTALSATAPLHAQGGGNPDSPQRQAQRLDGEGRHAEARAIWQRLIDEAPDPGAKAAAQRRMAMHYGFQGDCSGAIKYEEMVIAYWVTREQVEPQNAHYQQGEMANEAARVCIDAGDLAAAETWYRKGSELGNREPEPRTNPRSLWDYRLAHALARINARRGNRSEALKHVAEARRILDSDTAMARPQERFYPYLVGYVALYTDDLKTAETEFTRGLEVRANQNDPFQHYLLALTYEKLGQPDKARPLYEKAYSLAGGHNPPAAFTRPAARKKLAAP
jgi:tetratricopeptide (TPR) repeat protein